MVACRACDSTNPQDFLFCGACGSPLTAAAPAEPREERRTVTVLFADLAGFTSRAETMDPEDVRAFLHPWYALLEHEVTGHGGVVERHLGDGIMALFGAPTAHEDDPERAVRAALRILERLPSIGLDLHARLGINTGEVLFAAASGPGREDAVTGDAVNTAARLQGAAPVDGVVLGETTYRLTSRLFRWQPMEPVAAKGKAEPVPAWRPLEPVSRSSGELFEETTPFVGRDHELQTLVRLFERARSTPSLEVVTIVAEPGIGKSRLVRELGRCVDALPELVTWRVGRCLPYGEGIGFWALSEIVKAQAGILDTDDQATVASKLDAAITEPDPSLRRWLTQRVGPLVGLEVTTEPPQPEEAYTAWRRFLESIATTGPLVLIVEDLHWADEALVAFLRHIADNTTELPVLLLVTARPEVEGRHPGWLECSAVLRLDPLPDSDIAMLVAGSFPDASPELRVTILERAAGSPLYAEQLAAMVRDRPDRVLDEAAIPATLQGLLASRIDRLTADNKAVLLDASVVGKTFWSGAVAALGGRERAAVEPLLAELARRDLIRPVHPTSMAGEQEFSFVHALVRDVAYGGLTRSSRLTRHRATAAWLTEQAGAALGEGAEIVVAHLERAHELAEATGASEEVPAIRDGLVEALLRAASHALATQPPTARGFVHRALELLGPDDPRRPEALATLGRSSLWAFDYAAAVQALDAADAALRRQGDLLAVAHLAPLRSRALPNAGESARGEATLEEARAVLEAAADPVLADVLTEQALDAMVSGDLARAAALSSEAVALAAAHGRPPPYRALVARGVAQYGVDPEASEGDLLEAAAGAEAAGDLYTAFNALYNRASVQGDCLGVAQGLAAADEGMAFGASHGLPTERFERARLGLLLGAGRWDEAVESARRLRAWAIDRGDASTQYRAGWALTTVALGRGEPTGPLDELAALGRATAATLSLHGALVAEAAIARGDQEAAIRAIEAILDESPAQGLWDIEALVRVALLAGAPELARRALMVGALPRSIGKAETLQAQAELAEYDQRFADARATHEAALVTCRSIGRVVNEAQTLLGLGRCLLKLGETEEGVSRLHEARELWVGMKAKPRIAEIDELLATVA